MTDRLVLHIGTMKSGTTFLQQVLGAYADALDAAGVHYPPLWRDGFVPNHQSAFYGLIAEAIPWISAEQITEESAAAAIALTECLRSRSGTVLLSAEALTPLDEAGVQSCLEALGVPAERVHVVVTARDLGRVIPSAWQQTLRGGHITDYDGFLRRIARSAPDAPPASWTAPGRLFWRGYGISDVVRRWSTSVPIDHITVVSVPRDAAEAELWRRFKAAAGLPAGIPDETPTMPPTRANTGATAPEAAVLGELATRLVTAGVPRVERARMISDFAATVLAVRSERGGPVRLPGEWLARVQSWAAADLAGLRACGVRIVGDEEDLLVQDSARPAEPIQLEDVVDIAVAAAMQWLTDPKTVVVVKPAPAGRMLRFRWSIGRMIRRVYPRFHADRTPPS